MWFEYIFLINLSFMLRVGMMSDLVKYFLVSRIVTLFNELKCVIPSIYFV